MKEPNIGSTWSLAPRLPRWGSSMVLAEDEHFPANTGPKNNFVYRDPIKKLVCGWEKFVTAVTFTALPGSACVLLNKICILYLGAM